MPKLNIKIVIPNYPDKITIAKSRRAIPYISPTSTSRGNNRIPKRYLKNTTKYAFDTDGILVNTETQEYVLSNPRTAGKPRYWIVNFQDIWNQAMTKHARNARAHILKEIFRPYISKIKPITKFPVSIAIHLFDTACPVDVSNRGVIYTKIIEDLLVAEGKLPDDTIDYVNDTGRCTFTYSPKKRMEIVIKESETPV